MADASGQAAPGSPTADVAAEATAEMAHEETGWTWAELVAHATLGTGRRPTVPTRTVAGRPLSSSAAQRQLLDAAAAMSAGIRASLAPTPVGRPDDRWTGPVEEPGGAAPAAALRLLDALLSGVVERSLARSLVLLWLTEAAHVGWRIPGDRIDGVLAVTPTPVPGDVVAALGRRARWLAGIGTGSWAIQLIDVEGARAAVAGSATGRRLTAATVRLWESAPAVGRGLRQERWSGWSPQRRVAVLEGLQLSGAATEDDEAWLEGVLDEPRPAAVVAATILRTIPSSRLVARMAVRLPEVVSVTGTGLLVDRRVSPDSQAARDRTEEHPSVGGWTRDVLAAAPLRAWVELCGSRTRAVELQHGSPRLLPDLVTAAAAHGDTAWALDLLGGLLTAHTMPLAPGEPADRFAQQTAQRRWQTAILTAVDALDAPLAPDVTADLLSWAARHPQPDVALALLSAALIQRGGPDLDVRLADAQPAGPAAEQIAAQIRRITTGRSLRRAILDMAAEATSTT